MASNPPLQVEDQTDEDFFDKLVDDDDEFKVTASSAQSFADGNDSDEVKAFANLSIGEVAAGSEDSGGEGVSEAKGKATGGEDVNAVAIDRHVEESSSLVSANSFGFDSVIESNGEAIGTEGTTDSIISKSNESPGSGVKEVQWTAFNSGAGWNGSNGFGSYSDFFSELGDATVDPTGQMVDNFNTESKIGSGGKELKTTNDDNNYNYGQYQESQAYGEAMGQNADGQDLNCSQYWENIYPGWKYDLNTGQWYQVDGYDATGNVQGRLDSNSTGGWAASDGNSQVSYLKQTTQSFVGTVNENGTTESISNWNQGSQQGGGMEGVSNWSQVSTGNNEYPAHMVFDPQYPGWYYDTIAQEWRSLERYTSSPQSEVQAHGHSSQNGITSTGTFSQIDDKKTHGGYGQVENYMSEGFGANSQHNNWSSSFNNYNQQGLNMWQPATVAESEAPPEFIGNRQWVDDYGSKFSTNTHVNQQESYDSGGTIPFSEKATQGHHDFAAASRGFIPSGNFNQQVDQPSMQQNKQVHVSKDYYSSQNSVNFLQQQSQSSQQFSHVSSNVGRSSAGRPPHALVTFGFGGKLIVMKDNSSLSTSSFGNQGSLGGFISVLNLVEVVTERIDPSVIGPSSFDYFNTLCRQSFPGPIVGGSVGNKELNKWIDERISNCESAEMDYRKAEVLRLLLSLLKIACQYYGKLRSPFGTDPGSRESDVPESAVAKLFASAKKNGTEFGDYGALAHCLQKLPSEGQMQATAAEVQSLLVSGRKKEALHCASGGQLWGPALVLAAQLGDQFYVDTVKQMALCQLVAGSPLRTLCLLIAGQPAEVFSTYIPGSSIPGAVNVPPQPAQYGANYMLDDWEENLAVITANRTKDDELVLIHLGDCLWKERSDIIAAHICYLVAEANFEPYSDSARLCLIGADHWKFPRTYASPDAIQRTELYEYSKVLGNPQFILLSFQPYKLIYAHMLAEVGKVTESLKYCHAISKSLKTGRASEVDTWRQLASSLEERIRTHQQGGYSANLAPGKLVGKLLNLFDSTAHRVVGGLPPPVPSTSQGGAQTNEHYQTMVPRVSTSQSTMAMSSLMPSASMEPMTEWTVDGNRMKVHNRSVSEPDFGRTPIQHQVDSAKEAASSNTQGKASVSGRASRFGRFSLGSQLLQKTVGFLRPRQDRQAKLGEENRFYYDEKLKRWVEEGAEPPAEEAALPPPPTATAFQNGTLDYNLRSAMKSENSATNGNPEFTRATPLEQSSGIPPIPPATNQFSARGRTGVRSRYVDTFNKGGGNPTNLFQSPSAPSIKPAASGSNPKFFVPTPVSSSEQGPDTTITHNTIPSVNDSFDSPAPTPTPPTTTMQFPRFPSMDNISNKERSTKGNGPLSSHSRRTASWSGSFNGDYTSPQTTEAKPLHVGSFSNAYNSPPQTTEVKSLGEVLGISPPTNDGSLGDDLQEVEL